MKYITNDITVLIKVMVRAVPVVPLRREMFHPIASNTPGGRKRSENRKGERARMTNRGL